MTSAATVAFVHHGCPKNLVDAEVMGGILHEAGYQVIDDPDCSDVVIINTCGFIEDAKKESLDEIFLHLQTRSSHLVVSGCLAQRYADELRREIPELRALIGVDQIDQIAEAVRQVTGGDTYIPEPSASSPQPYDASRRFRSTPRHFGYVRIAQGCSRTCSFCAIPLIRGPYRSKDPELVRSEVEALVHDGAREVVLIAQDTTEYGADGREYPRLPELLESLSSAHPKTWFRLMYAHPDGITSELLQVISDRDNVCSYLDIPLQHVSPPVLRRMGRRGDPRRVQSLLEWIRREVPDVSIRTSLIVGHPGEGSEEFDELLGFVRRAPIDHTGIFSFSREEGTRAAEMPDQVSGSERRSRYNRLRQAAERQSREVKQRLVGRVLPALVDGHEDGSWLARHHGQAPEIDGYIYLPDGALEQGQRVQVEITGADAVDLWGALCDEERNKSP